jgi:hypothetical protein
MPKSADFEPDMSVSSHFSYAIRAESSQPKGLVVIARRRFPTRPAAMADRS